MKQCAVCKSDTQTELFEQHTNVTDPKTGKLLRMRSCTYEKCVECKLIYNYINTEWLDPDGYRIEVE